MKQYHADRENPEGAKERDKKLSSATLPKPSKKVSVAGMANWHSLQIETLLGPIVTNKDK